jgi:1,4-dihydroxy-2-naphthoate octaprenyltransferase
MSTISVRIRAWLMLSRPPFHLVGVLPFLLGTTIAYRLDGVFRPVIVGWGILGVVAIMLATYFAGEYWDFEEDSAGLKYGRNRYAGGSGVIQDGLLPRVSALKGSLASLVAALTIGIILQFYYGTGPLTIPLGVLGIIGGFFYSTRPVRWSTRGFGEAWIALCYGWLPVAIGHYLQTGTIRPEIHWISIPIGLTIFNVILLNEFPDYRADLEAGKRNLLVRIGHGRSVFFYAIASVFAWIGVAISLTKGVSRAVGWFYLPVMLLSVALVFFMLKGSWQDPKVLDKLCAGNLLVNLATTGVFILSYGVS